MADSPPRPHRPKTNPAARVRTTGNLLRVLVPMLVLVAVVGGATTAQAAPPDGKGPDKTSDTDGDGSTCKGKKCTATTTTTTTTTTTAPADTTAPTVSIMEPADGASVPSGTVRIDGGATDDEAVDSVSVSVDGGAPVPATGTSSWVTNVELDPGTHVVTARAVDSSGNSATVSISLVAESAAESDDDFVLEDPRATYELLPLGRTHTAEWGNLTGVLYTEQFTNRRAIAFRDASSGTTSYVDLPTDSLAGWTSAATVMTSARDLWVFGGTGPLSVRHYALEGSAMPTTATLVEHRMFGDSDSREGDMTALASGGLVIVWHQHGATGPQAQFISYRSPTGPWQDLPALTFMPTRSSDQVVSQHPSDGSIWLFSNPDAWGAIGAVHLTETAGGLRVDWTDATFLNTTDHGQNGPDPENPNLAIDADAVHGTMTLGYQSADRQRFSDGTSTAIGSRVALATIDTTGVPSFLTLPVWAERVSSIGLVAHDGERVVSYSPIDEATLRSDEVHVRRYRDGTWQPAEVFGAPSGTDRVTYASSRAEFATRLADGRIHLRTF